MAMLGKNPSVRALTIAARRAGAEEAARRRQRTLDLAEAVRRPLRRSFFTEWRERSQQLYSALLLRNELAKERTIRHWLDYAYVQVLDRKRRWLRRWRCMSRVRIRRYEKEDTLALASYRRQLSSFMVKLAARARQRAILRAADDVGSLARLRKGCRLWHRIASKQAAVRALVAGRSALRCLRRHARIELTALVGRCKVALLRWRRHLTLLAQRELLAVTLKTLAQRAQHLKQHRQVSKTLRFAAVWHHNRSTMQHVLARMLIVGWRTSQHDSRMADARLIGDAKNAREVLQRWRHHAVRFAEWQATRAALRRGVYASSAPQHPTYHEVAHAAAYGHSSEAARRLQKGQGRRRSWGVGSNDEDFLASRFPATTEDDEGEPQLLHTMTTSSGGPPEAMRRAAGIWMNATGVSAASKADGGDDSVQRMTDDGASRRRSSGAAFLLAMAEDALNSPSADPMRNRHASKQQPKEQSHLKRGLESGQAPVAAEPPAVQNLLPTAALRHAPPVPPSAGATEKAALLLDQLVRHNAKLGGKGSCSGVGSGAGGGGARSALLPSSTAHSQARQEPDAHSQKLSSKDGRGEGAEGLTTSAGVALLSSAPAFSSRVQAPPTSVSSHAMAELRARLSLQVASPSYLAHPPIKRSQEHPREGFLARMR